MNFSTPLKSTVLYDDGNTVIRHECANSRVLAVLFCPMRMIGVEAPTFSETFLRKNGVDIVAVQRRGETWYQDLPRRVLHEALRPIRSQYERTVFYGSSLGAYAALYYALDEPVLAFSPRIPIHPRFRMFARKEDLNDTAFVHDPLGYSPNSIIVFDPLNAWDRKFVASEVKAPHSSFYAVPFAGHSTITFLSEAKILGEVVLSIIRDGKPLDRKLLLAARKNSPKVHVHLADVCEDKGHLYWAALAILRGLERWPEHKDLLSRKRKFEAAAPARPLWKST